jgi:hypothetical protein
VIEITLCKDETHKGEVAYGILNPDAVAVAELLDPDAADYRRTIVRITLTFGKEIFVTLQGGQLTSDRDEHLRRYREFSRTLLRSKSPLAALSIDT